MNDPKFLDQFDKLSGDVIAKLSEALTITIKDLKCSNTEMALAQIEAIRERTVHRLQKLDRDLDLLDRPEEHVTKVHGIVLTIINHVLDDAKEFVVDCDKSIYGSDDDNDLAELT